MLEHLSHLKELFLTGNQFLMVPESLSLVGKSLEILRLNENPIEIIDEKSFIGLEKLEQLNISSCPELTDITENALIPLKLLEVFHCRGNEKLTNFHMENLRELENLKDLDISDNALTKMEFGEMEFNKNAENLDGSEPNEKYKNQFKQLRILKLAGNPWNCDCRIMQALSLFDHTSRYYNKSLNNDEARCKTPSGLSSRIIYQLSHDYTCNTRASQKDLKIPIYDPPQFLRPKSIMLTVFSVVGVVVLGVIIGFAIVCIKRRLKANDPSYRSDPIRYTTVRDSTVSNIANLPYSQ